MVNQYHKHLTTLKLKLKAKTTISMLVRIYEI